MKKMDRRWYLLLYGLIALVFFGAFVKLEFATDTYADIMMPAKGIIANFVQSGRFITLGFFIVFRGLYIDINVVSFLSFVVAIVSLVMALYILEGIFERLITKNRVWAGILPLLIIINPFIVELFLFIEKGVMLFGILLAVLTVYYFAEYLKGGNRSDLIKSIGMSIGAAVCYQGIVGLIITLIALIVIVQSKHLKDFIRNTLIGGLVYIIGPVVDILIAKILSSGGRIGGEIILRESLSRIWHGTWNMLGIFEIMPVVVFWGLFGLIMLVGGLTLLMKRREMSVKDWLILPEVIYLVLVVVLAAVAPQIVQSSEAIWIAPRSAYVFGALNGVVLALMIWKMPSVLEAWREKILLIGVGVYVVSEFMGLNTIILDRYSMNEIDRLRAERIGAEILAYEQKSGTEVRKVMVAQDGNMMWSYPGIFNIASLNGSAFSTAWSDVNSLSYWNGRYFERVETSEGWSQYCAGRDWQYYDEEQIGFDGDMMMICVW